MNPYARCKTCGLDLPTKDEQSAHMSATLDMARRADPSAQSVSGHTTTVVNPTPEEVESNRLRHLIDSAIERAINECCEELDDEVRRGRITEEQVKEGLRFYFDFADAWDEWISEDES